MIKPVYIYAAARVRAYMNNKRPPVARARVGGLYICMVLTLLLPYEEEESTTTLYGWEYVLFFQRPNCAMRFCARFSLIFCVTLSPSSDLCRANNDCPRETRAEFRRPFLSDTVMCIRIYTRKNKSRSRDCFWSIASLFILRLSGWPLCQNHILLLLCCRLYYIYTTLPLMDFVFIKKSGLAHTHTHRETLTLLMCRARTWMRVIKCLERVRG